MLTRSREQFWIPLCKPCFCFLLYSWVFGLGNFTVHAAFTALKGTAEAIYSHSFLQKLYRVFTWDYFFAHRITRYSYMCQMIYLCRIYSNMLGLSSYWKKLLPRVVSLTDVQHMDKLISVTPPDCLPSSLLERLRPIMCYLAVLSVWEDVNWRWGASLPHHQSSGVSQSQERWHKAWPRSALDSLGPEGTRRLDPVCVEAIPEAPGVNLYARMENVPREQHKEGTQPFFVFVFSVRNKSENYFQFRSQSGSKKRSCLLFSAVQSSLLGDWSSPNKCVFVCAWMCVCVSPGSCLPSVCLPWIGLLSPSQWRATQPGWIFFPPHLLQIYQSQAIQRLLYGAVSSTVTASYNTHTHSHSWYTYTPWHRWAHKHKGHPFCIHVHFCTF